jgi:hypothetical protein
MAAPGGVRTPRARRCRRACSCNARKGSTGTKRSPRALAKQQGRLSDPTLEPRENAGHAAPTPRAARAPPHRALSMNSGVSRLPRFFSLKT